MNGSKIWPLISEKSPIRIFCGRERDVVDLARGGVDSFVVGEEERAVPDDRPAEGAAELMLVVHRVPVCKEVALVEARIPVELVRRTVELVGPRLGDEANDAAPRAAGLSRIEVGLDADFLDGVHRRLDADRADEALVVVHAVDLVVVLAAGAAVDRHRRGLPAIIHVAASLPAGRRRPRHHRHDIDEVASDDRQVLDGLFGDQRAQRRSIGLEERGLGRDLHGLGDHADVQPPIDASAVAARQDRARGL